MYIHIYHSCWTGFPNSFFPLVSDNVVCLWKMGDGGGGAGGNITMDTATPNKENWSVTKMLR